MTDFNIKCPRCGFDISDDELLKDKLSIETERIKSDATKQAQDQAKKDVEKIKADAVKQAQENADKANQEQQSKIDELSESLEKQKENEEKIKADSLSQAKEKIELEKGKFELERGKFELKIDKIKKEQEVTVKRLQTKSDDMQRQLHQKSMEMQGEIQEELIQDFIKRKFPQDNLEEIKKGTSGADCLLTINSTEKNNIGKILIESKDTVHYNDDWVAKLLNDLQESNAKQGILVTKAVPKDFPKDEGYIVREGGLIVIIKFDYILIHAIIEMVRNRLIDIDKADNVADVSEEMKKLWDHMTGTGFSVKFRRMHNKIKDLKKSKEKQDKFLRKHLANDSSLMDDLEDTMEEMILDFVRAVGIDSVPNDLIEYTGD